MKIHHLFLIGLSSLLLTIPAEGGVSKLDKKYGTQKTTQKRASNKKQASVQKKQTTKPSPQKTLDKKTAPTKEPVATAKNTLPSNNEALATLLSLSEKGNFNIIPYSPVPQEALIGNNYDFLSQPKSTELLFANDDFLVTLEKLSGDYMYTYSAIHVWDSRDFKLIRSFMYSGNGLESPCVYISERHDMVLSVEPDRYGEGGGVYACNLLTGESEIYRYNSVSEGWNIAEGSNHPFKKAAFKRYPQEGKLAASSIPFSNIKALQQVPQLAGLSTTFYDNDEHIIRSIDYSSLSYHPKEDKSANISTNEIQGIPANVTPAFEEIDSYNGKFVAVYPKQQSDLNEACRNKSYGDEPNLYIGLYNVQKNELYPMPEQMIELRSSAMAAYPAYGESDCGNIVFNLVYSKQGIGYYEPAIINPQTGNVRSISFEGKKSDAQMPLDSSAPTAYHMSGQVKEPYKLGLSMSVWNKVPDNDTHSYWIAAGEGNCALFYIDENTKRGHLVQSWQGEWGSTPWVKHARNPIWMADKQWLFLPVRRNYWEVYEIKDFSAASSKKFSIYTGSGSSWAIVLPDGRYSGTPRCERLFFIKDNSSDETPHAPYAILKNRPGEVLEELGGNEEDIAALKETTKRWLSRQGINEENLPEQPKIQQDYPVVHTPTLPLRTTDNAVSFTATIYSGTKKATTELEVRVNGAIVPQKANNDMMILPGKEAKVPVTIPLQTGQNMITITPIDSMGLREHSRQFRVIKEGTASSRLFVVALGTSNYDDDEITDLELATKDAHDVCQAFSEYGGGEVKTLILTDKDVTRASALNAVQDFFADSTLEDRVILYLAGHGVLNEDLVYHYAPSDIDSARISETGISINDLIEVLTSAPARERLLLMDTCHSGQLGEAGEEKLAENGITIPHNTGTVKTRGMKVRKANLPELKTEKQQKRYIEEMFTMGNEYRGVNIVAGAAGAEYALESAQWNNGVFTASLIQTMQDFSTADTNRDGILSVSELLPAVQKKVSKLTGGAQQPNTIASENGNMLIATGTDNDMMVGNWRGVAKSIAKADNTQQALFILDKICSFYAGNESYVADFNNLSATWQKQGRGYNSTQLNELKLAFNLMHPTSAEHQQTRVSPISAAVWIAAMNQGVEVAVVAAYVDNWREAEDAKDVVRAMVQHGYKGDTHDIYGDPVMFRLPAEALEILLQAGADVNMQDKYGNTLLHRVFDRNSLSLSPSAYALDQALVALKHGVNTGIRNKKGVRVDTSSALFKGISKLAGILRKTPTSTSCADSEGFAPASLEGKKLVLYYDNALSVYTEYDGAEEENQQITSDDIKSLPTVIHTRFATGSEGAHKYMKTGSNTAIIHRYPTGEGISPLLTKYSDRLTHEQMKEIAYTCSPCDVPPAIYKIKFNSATSGIADFEQAGSDGSCEMIRSIRVILLKADTPLP